MSFLARPAVQYKGSFLMALREAHEENRHLQYRYDEIAANFEQFVQSLLDREDPHKLSPGRVPDSVFWLIDQDEYIGRVSVRHALNNRLRKIGGHIGYDIRPTKRRLGYGTRILKLALAQAKLLDLPAVMITCDADNIASKKIIEKNGGQFEKALSLKGEPVEILHYWINFEKD